MRDCPHALFEAIRSALVFLSFEELPKDERPDKRIWLNGAALKEHFERVERNRDAKAQGKDIEDPVTNAAAAGLIVE